MTEYTVDDNGFVTFKNVPISRSGVFQYTGAQLQADLPDAIPDKIYNVYRPSSALNNQATIKSFNSLPWFNKHKMVGDDYDAPESVGVQGTTGEDTYYNEGDNRLYTTLRLFGRGLKQAIKSGLNQLSCGMKCKYRWESGVSPDGQKYDVVQDSIQGNHLASVPLGRAGADVAVAMDEFNIDLNNKDDGGTMTLEEMLAAIKEMKPSLEQMNAIQDALKSLAGGDPATESEEPEQEEQPEPPAVGEDEDGEDMPDEKEPVAMDAAVIGEIVAKSVKPLQDEIKTLKSSAMDEASVMAAFTERQELANQVTPLIGQFDYSKMNRQQVAKYATEKLGVACDDGQEVVALKAFLAGRKQSTYTVATPNAYAQDAADAKPNKTLSDAGL